MPETIADIQDIFDNVPGAYTEVERGEPRFAGYDESGRPVFKRKVSKITNFTATVTPYGFEVKSDNSELLEAIKTHVKKNRGRGGK